MALQQHGSTILAALATTLAEELVAAVEDLSAAAAALLAAPADMQEERMPSVAVALRRSRHPRYAVATALHNALCGCGVHGQHRAAATFFEGLAATVGLSPSSELLRSGVDTETFAPLPGGPAFCPHLWGARVLPAFIGASAAEAAAPTLDAVRLQSRVLSRWQRRRRQREALRSAMRAITVQHTTAMNETSGLPALPQYRDPASGDLSLVLPDTFDVSTAAVHVVRRSTADMSSQTLNADDSFRPGLDPNVGLGPNVTDHDGASGHLSSAPSTTATAAAPDARLAVLHDVKLQHFQHKARAAMSRRCFAQWQRRWAERREHVGSAIAVEWHRQRALSAVLHCWSRAAAARRLHRQCATRGLLHKWRDATLRRQAAASARNAVLGRYCLRRWQEALLNKRADTLRRGALLAQCTGHWRHRTAKRVDDSAAASAAQQELQRSAARRRLLQWWNATFVDRPLRSAAAAHHHTSLLRRAVTTWRARLDEARTVSAATAEIAERLRPTIAAAVLGRWRSRAAVTAHCRIAQCRAAHRALAGTFAAWRQETRRALHADPRSCRRRRAPGIAAAALPLALGHRRGGACR